MESIRVIMLRNWHFDIVNREHWQIAWDLWTTTWVISEPKEWAFVFIVISFIPLWFTGWIALSMVSWGKFIWFIITLPWRIIKNIFYRPVKIITNSATTVPVTKRVSYKEIRPRALKGTPPFIEQTAVIPTATTTPTGPVSAPVSTSSPVAASPIFPSPSETQNSVFEHTLFKFDDSSDDVDFDIDSFDVQPKPRQIENRAPKYTPSKYSEEDFEEEDLPRRPSRSQRRSYEEPEYRSERKNKEPRENKSTRGNNNDKKYNKDVQHSTSQKANNSCIDIIKQKGFEVINRLIIKNITIDYTAISANCIYLCLLDREDGDWLADEERFNDEEPLWFSENSHRISPIRKLDIVKQAIINKLSDTELNFKVEAILVEQIGNIINAEDMLEIWDSMDIKVCRIDRGMPKELQPFARVLPEADKHISSGKLDKLTKILRNIDKG